MISKSIPNCDAFVLRAVLKALGAAAREWFKLHPEDKQKLYKGHLWSPSFFMQTVGVVPQVAITEYVENQHTKEPRRH